MKSNLWFFSAVIAAVTAFNGGNQQQPLTTTPSSIPLLGFGTWNLDRSNASDAVSAALQAGYRHLDCATIYGNQKEVGKGIADGLNKTGLKRSDIWITSKLWNDHHDPALVPQALEETLSDLGIEYLDLWLMHWPVGSSHGSTQLDYLSAWQAMSTVHQTTTKTRQIGISNFSPDQLSSLLKNSTTKPSVHQFEAHPYLPQTSWIEIHKQHGIAVTAYSPFANTNPTYNSGDDDPPLLLKNKEMETIAAENGCTVAQVALAWGIARGTAVIPKSAHVEHIVENFGSLECKLNRAGIRHVDELKNHYLKRFNNPSESYGIKLFEGLEDS